MSMSFYINKLILFLKFTKMSRSEELSAQGMYYSKAIFSTSKLADVAS